MTTIADRLAVVNERIRSACERSDRDPATVTLVAVAKTFPADAVVAAVDAGATDIGENRAQELTEKAAVIARAVRWHFIGHLQSNKVRQVVGVASLIHSVDRFGVAEAIARRANALELTQDVLIEVNIAGEASKTGIEPTRAASLADEVAALEGVRVRGVMSMPPVTDDPEGARPYLGALAALGADIAARIEGATEVSMGMTHDLEVAVEEGATLVRVGEAIFGPRNANRRTR